MAFPPKGKVATKVPAAKSAVPPKPPGKGAMPMMAPGAGFKKGGAVKKKGC